MWYKVEKLVCYILIIFLLPYIVTIFINGPMVASSTGVENSTIKVVENEDEEEKDISIQEYGIGVLAREMPASYESGALEAQAVLVRTKIYKHLQENGSDAAFSEEYWSREEMEEAWGFAKFSSNYNKLEQAWQQTEGEVLLYEGELVLTPFFYLSNGSTRDGEEVLGEGFPYLKIRECPKDVEAVDQLQTVTVDDADIEILASDSAGYVLEVRVGEEKINGEEFRSNYGLASSCFSVHPYEGKLRITTRGVGHGIGLSQNTANEMAKEGYSRKEILSYFYEGCEMKEVSDFVKKIE